MITCDLIGRLGNQLFQIATTATTAWRNGTDFAFPTKAMGSYTGETYFNHLPVVPRRLFQVYREQGHHYTPIPPMKDGKLHGYWQSSKYFDDYRDKVIDLLQMPPIPQPYDCSIHIRLGDYVQFKDKHPPVTVDYLKRAVETMKAFGANEFLVFSDDIGAATKMIQNEDWSAMDADFIFCTEPDPKLSMRMMAGCKHNIIANSSFSWWAAYLGDQEGRHVVAPKLWFGPGNSNLTAQDIYCENWIVL